MWPHDGIKTGLQALETAFVTLPHGLVVIVAPAALQVPYLAYAVAVDALQVIIHREASGLPSLKLFAVHRHA